MTMTTPRGPESTVLRMVGNAMHLKNIEVETGWHPDEIRDLAKAHGFALNAASQRFQRAPVPKPAPAGIVRTTPQPGADEDGFGGDAPEPYDGPRLVAQTSTGAERPSPTPSPAGVSDPYPAPVLPETSGEASIAGGEGSLPSAPVAASPELESVKPRKSGLTTLDLHTLDRAVDMFLPPEWAWDTYLVGTAQTGGVYRDVDVRTILEDDEFDAVFRTRKNLWGAWCFAIGTMLRTATGLPIDYQVQRRTEANEKHPGGGRNPVGRSRREYAGGGDATQFTSCDICLDRVGPTGPVVLCDRHSPAKPAPQPRLTHGASQSQIRAWAKTQGLDVNPRGSVRTDIADAYAAAHRQET